MAEPKRDPLLEHCRSLPATTEDVKWGDDLVFSVGGKMYAAFDLPDLQAVYVKTDPVTFGVLTSMDGIEASKYLGRYHWIAVSERSLLPEDVLKELVTASWEMVSAKLTKRLRRELGLEG